VATQPEFLVGHRLTYSLIANDEEEARAEAKNRSRVQQSQVAVKAF
jgi:hypothetical protein